MGTWATHAFGNDYAQDWAEDLQETRNMEAVENTLDTALGHEGDVLEAPYAAEALVAIEVIARLQGHWGLRDDDTEILDLWIAEHPQRARKDLAEKAHRVIDRILSEQSELRQLWAETAHYDDWRAAVEELRGRVSL
ncbi:DUF4259 domain-containing protein [Duganella sp. LX20W]|uniref:DUF4259 domain-containing protein n=1 Tax=Rugamonas brunnea TaxID=2758569 RepID=A0A7W2ICW0_9BURK|nr:DUF4259 domain-containing protein [Rugamonas brunnea]MBA5638640.1 DUF4259 domain-containing protein [Rugamonas brunnea]